MAIKDASVISKYITKGKESQAESIANKSGFTLKSSGGSSGSTPKPTTDASVLRQFITPGKEAEAEKIAKQSGQSIYGTSLDKIKPIVEQETKPITPVAPIAPVEPVAPTAPITSETALTDAQIEDYRKQGFTEGMNVPGKGILTPEGTFRQAPDLKSTYNQIASVPPTGVDISNASDSKAAINQALTTSQGAPVPPGGQEIMDYYDNDENKELTNIEKAYNDFYSPKNQKDSLMNTYKTMVKDSGLADINAELIDAKRIINGTEDDIRTEITKAGGFATESQVQGMTNARNKTLIANYNTLLETKNAITEQIGNMMQYAQADRQYAQQQFESRMNFEMKKMEYGQQAKQYAANQLQKIADTVGYAGLLSMTGGDPYTTAKVEKALGLGQGGLVQLASQPDIDRQIKEAQLAKIKAETAEVVGTGPNNLTGEFSSVVNGVYSLLGPTKGEQIRNDLNSQLSSGDYSGAYATLGNAVEESLTGTNKTKFSDARTDYQVMAGLKDAIQNYADAGGDMGLLTGTEESIKRKLGIDSGNASELATQLWREFQSYRVNMTGAAFSPAESRDYASVNPTLGKSLDLNLSIIDGALNQLENRITGTINARIPGAKDVFTKAFPETKNTTPPIDTTPEEDAAFNQVVGSNPPSKVGSFFSDIWKAITE